MKTHISLPARDLDASVRFYSTLLNQPPTKRLDDYALFITENPGLELALNRSTSARAESAAHYGFAVRSQQEIDDVAGRLRAAGLHVEMELEEVCCYAKQTKAWVSDPDGRRWETYVVLEEVAAEACCT
ncbi:MAG: VOC family protein [Candidatus Eremiobacteraeota bacterium]|nr:VOC family protein [Candidatus Eremiobacteraeota bacterium]